MGMSAGLTLENFAGPNVGISSVVGNLSIEVNVDVPSYFRVCVIVSFALSSLAQLMEVKSSELAVIERQVQNFRVSFPDGTQTWVVVGDDSNDLGNGHCKNDAIDDARN